MSEKSVEDKKHSGAMGVGWLEVGFVVGPQLAALLDAQDLRCAPVKETDGKSTSQALE